ncbi:hypothetical protein [Priestia megaterium]|uniref:hypothetical protein n=1 Tax=Priestia megaterium TaxID=1404 RepID=UPI00101D5417|nr:hypothetical protein [Priestia megaterium]
MHFKRKYFTYLIIFILILIAIKIHNSRINNSNFVTPENYGYGKKSNDLDDDTKAINAALKSGKEVHFLAKTYTVKVPSSNKFYALEANGHAPRIKGVKGKTIIKLKLYKDKKHVINSKSGILVAWNTEISDIIFDGGFNYKKNQANLSSMVNIGSNSKVYNCKFKNSKGSNLLVSSSNVRVFKNSFSNFGDHAIYIIKERTDDRSSNIYIYNNEINENDNYQNSNINGRVRGAVKIRDNVEDVHISNNKIHGDECILVSGKAASQASIPSNVHISNNQLFTTYSGVHLDTELVIDNGYRITNRNVIVKDNLIFLKNDNTSGISLTNSRGEFVKNYITSISFKNTNTTGITNFSTGDTDASTVINNNFVGMRVGIYSLGTDSVIKDNKFFNITEKGGCAIYLNYSNQIVKNKFVNCLEEVREQMEN